MPILFEWIMHLQDVSKRVDSHCIVIFSWFKKKRDLSVQTFSIEKIEFFGASVSVLQTNKTMKKYARVMEARYKICHYPDSLVLSAAKFYDLPIVTLDKDMLKIAKCEKIAIYDTRKLKDMKNNV